MVWTVMFQGITAFVFIIIFCNDKHNQAIVSQKKRFWYSILFFGGTELLLRLFLVKKSQLFILHNIFGLSAHLPYILDVIIKGEGVIPILHYFVVLLPIFLFLHFPSFLIFWIQFSKNKKIKIKTTILYVLWCAISICLCLAFPDREQRAAQLQKMMEEKTKSGSYA